MEMKEMPFISTRAKSMQRYTSRQDKYLTRLKANPFHKTKNPQGIIEMMTSENPLAFDLLKEKLEEKESYNILQEHTQYFCSIADFLNHYMKPVEPILAENLIVSNGCTPILDSLGYVIADAGEGLLIPSPFYGSFTLDFQTRSRVIPFPVPLSSEIGPGETQPFELTVARLECALKKATEQGVKIRGLLLCNPNNPLSTTYSEELLQDCLKFAARHSLHVIMDEVYMLCGFKEGCSVTNVLSLKNVPDKKMIHVIWGFRFWFIWISLWCSSYFEQRCLSSDFFRIFEIPGPTDSHADWLDETFIPTNQKRLRNAHQMACDALHEVGIPVLPGECGLYIWVDFREVLPTNTFEGEMELFDRLLDNGVAFYPGAWFLCAEPGWFRLVFAMESEILQLGLSRIQQTVRQARADIASGSLQ
ncbi:hypothetical protein pdam_00005638 [Pocillopora damicornis]|uniref:Aminotransferase class I/classII large domain-containing protein n=1 Tax=Pocillopora damicornis TaxID=46731 RepID=A0A3M6V5D9_POCDA|nr:hypothetical protein pdam_00005638 [Pocillopora damicornis]